MKGHVHNENYTEAYGRPILVESRAWGRETNLEDARGVFLCKHGDIEKVISSFSIFGEFDSRRDSWFPG